MQQIRIDASQRHEVGKGAARALRRAGSIPAVLYGHQEDPLSLQLDTHTFERLVATQSIESMLINLHIDGSEETVMVKEIQRDPVSRRILHTDFLRVSLTEAVTTRVPLVLEGSPLGVREEGGILEFAQREFGIRCLPTEIPSQIQIAVDTLAVGDTIHVGDLRFPEAFEALDDPSTMLLSVRPPIVREVPQEELEEKGEEPELISRRREEEGEE